MRISDWSADVCSSDLSDIKAALKAAKPKEVTTLEELAGLWGTSKQRFVTKRREFAGFPDKVAVEGNTHLYRLVPCLKALLANLERHQAAMQSRAKRLSELTGIDHMQAEVHGNLPIAEIAKANQLGTEHAHRARPNGLNGNRRAAGRDRRSRTGENSVCA